MEDYDYEPFEYKYSNGGGFEFLDFLDDGFDNEEPSNHYFYGSFAQ